LPRAFHKDTADHLIVAIVRTFHLTLLTEDRKIREFKHVGSICGTIGKGIVAAEPGKWQNAAAHVGSSRPEPDTH
jgi:hypothetical protein